jgi:four helix bundle protein
VRDDAKTRELLQRTQSFGVRAIRVIDTLPPGTASWVLGKQLVRSATSVGANYRSARRARSTSEFIAKLGIAEEEADESIYWMQMLIQADLVDAPRLTALMQEAEELLAIIVASIRTAKRRRDA